MPGPTIYDLLAQQDISETTQTQLNSASKSTAVTPDNVQFWSGMITVARAISESRTYGHGLPVPESGAVATASIGDSATGTFQPSTATEIWLVQSLDDSGDGTGLGWVLTDGTTQSAIPNPDNKGFNFPIYVTKSLYLQAINGSGGSLTGKVAYLKVSL